MTKIFNIGVTLDRGAPELDRPISFKVAAVDGDAAYERVKAFCASQDMKLQRGHTMQFRDERPNSNDWFDRNFPHYAELL
jgi:hypothetical protein